MRLAFAALALVLAAVVAPLAGAAAPPGCTYASTVYVCQLDESGECSDLSATGAGIAGTVGFATSDQSSCGSRTRIVTVSVGTLFANVAIVENSEGCAWQLSTPAGFTSTACPAALP